MLWFFVAVLLVTRAEAQSNPPVRLAVIAETRDASAASDLLTVEFSKNPQVTVLERNEIEKVYREQGLSAANRDYLKLGQVLGADGVLLVSAIVSTNGTGLRIRLIAVKPGVLLASERFSMPDDLARWAAGVAMRLDPLLPKLSVLVQDAVPVSVVNFRSAIQSPETREIERRLTTLALDRLSRERQLFVLERTRMQLLASEKDLKGLGDSAFWNGSYLLEGTIDRDGYSPDKITISARLVPPKGGDPVPIEVSGSRTDFPGVINQLADKVRDDLKLAGTAASWNPADEAQKYFEEATWALKWGLLEQAQSASDSAWALGKRDMDCALARLSAYSRAIPEVDPVNIRHIDLKGRVTYISVTDRPDPAYVDQALNLVSPIRILAERCRRLSRNRTRRITFQG
jgi:TolB-like protein